MTLNDSIQAFRLRVLAEAQRSGNVSATCRRYGISRTQFYHWRQRLDRYGPEDSAHADQAAACVDPWLRGAAARDDLARALARGVPAAALHEPPAAPALARWLSAVLEYAATASGLSPPGPDPGHGLCRRGGGVSERAGLTRPGPARAATGWKDVSTPLWNRTI
jgi:transposase-like protein